MYINQGNKIIEFIINRIDERLKKLQVDRLLFINTISLEELKRNKSAIIRLFIEVEDDLKQSSQALTSLLIQNKDLIEERDKLDKNIKIYEQKTNSLEKIILDSSNMKYNENHNVPIISMSDLETNNQKLIKNLSDLEGKLEQKEKYIIQLELENKEFKEKLERALEEFNKEKVIREELDNHFNRQIKVFEPHSYSSNNNSEEGNKDIDPNINYLNYLQERQEKKKIINQVIKDNLSNYEEDENDTYKLDTIIEKSLRNEQDDNNESIIERSNSCIRKINDNLDSLNYLEDKLGIDFLSKLLSPDVNCSYLDKIEKAIKEYESKKINI